MIILLRAVLTSDLTEDFRLVGFRLVAVGMKLVPLFSISVISLGSCMFVKLCILLEDFNLICSWITVVLRLEVSSSFNLLLSPVFVMYFLLFMRCWKRVRLLLILFIRCLINRFCGLLFFSSFILFLTAVISVFLIFSIFLFRLAISSFTNLMLSRMVVAD